MYLHMPASSPNLLHLPPGEQQIQPLAIQGADEESATVEPQSRVSDRSRSPQRKESPTEQSPQKQEGKKTMTEGRSRVIC